MGSVTWSPFAVRDVRRIYDYIARFNPAAARRVAAGIEQAAGRLARQPYVGRAATGGRRELVEAPYIIVYRVRPTETRILRVWHGAQDRSP